VAGVAGITAALRTALAARITLGGVTCRPYDEGDIHAGSIASLGIASWVLGEARDQRACIKEVVFPVFVYQLVDASVTASIGYAETAFESVVNGLGSDPTLGRACAYSEVDGFAETSYFREPSGQTIAVVQLAVRVTPFANAAALS
jgi:hypothetical protein